MRYADYLVSFMMRNAVGLMVVVLLVAVGWFVMRSRSGWRPLTRGLLGALSAAWIVVLLVIFANHARFPLFLDLMEGTIFQHFDRAAHLQPIYTAPTAEFVPFAYNVLYYYAAVPVGWVVGESLFALRLLSILATLGVALLIFGIIKRQSNSMWWGFVGTGLFAVSYWAMDSYIDTAHSDACFVLCSVAGSWMISAGGSRGLKWLGVLTLVLSFWFKQHGAIFLAGGLIFLTWEDGWRRSWPFWLFASVLGPGAYIFLGPALFGSHFHYFTYSVPSTWASLSVRGFVRWGGYIVMFFCWLAAAVLYRGLAGLRGRTFSVDIWQLQWMAAVATGLLGAMDPGSARNVFIPMATWTILVGVLGLSRMASSNLGGRREIIPYAFLVLSFALLAFNPRTVMISAESGPAYRDLIQFLRGLDGAVYAPTLGQLPRDFILYPAAHWVALDDMIRGGDAELQNHPMVQEILSPLLETDRDQYILANYPLTRFPWFEYLNHHFELEKDLQDRFRALTVLPGTYSHGWPRYLYRRSASRPWSDKEG
jgi:hypothetical protein